MDSIRQIRWMVTFILNGVSQDLFYIRISRSHISVRVGIGPILIAQKALSRVKTKDRDIWELCNGADGRVIESNRDQHFFSFPKPELLINPEASGAMVVKGGRGRGGKIHS